MPAGPRCCSWPMWGPHRSIDIAGSGTPEMSQNGQGKGATQRARPGKCNGHRPHTMGRGIAARPHWTPLDNQSTSREDGQVSWPGFRCHGACVETQAGNMMGGDEIADQTPGTGNPQAPPSDAAGRSADISVLFLVCYRGRVKRPHLHCWADAVA